MPKFTVFASERVHYAFDIEAESEEQAAKVALEHELSFDDATETDSFEIQMIEEKTNA